MGRGGIQPEAGPDASVSFGLLFGLSVDDDTDGVCGDVIRASQSQSSSVAPCQTLSHQLRALRRPVMLSASVAPCSSLVRVRLYLLYLRADYRAHLVQLLDPQHVLQHLSRHLPYGRWGWGRREC